MISGDVQVRLGREAMLERMLRVTLMVQRRWMSALPQSQNRAQRSACCRASWSSW